MKNISRHFIFVLALGALSMGSCSEWTETESLNINNPTIESQNPELYAKYLANLRDYRNTDHKVMYATFHNVAAPSSRAHHINCLPDSIDIVSLMRPDGLSAVEMDEIAEVRTKKGMKVVQTIDYVAIDAKYMLGKAAHEAAEAAKPEGEAKLPFMSFNDFLAKYVDNALAVDAKYNYDGLTLSYEGKSTMNMTEVEIAAYKATQNIMLDKIVTWKSANKDKMFILCGRPQNLINKAFLSQCTYMIISTQYAASASGVEQQVLAAIRSDVPRNNILVAASTFSLDKADLKTGYFGLNSAITEISYWIGSEHPSFTKAGMAILDVQNDYFNLSTVYKYSRSAMSTMNPAPKN